MKRVTGIRMVHGSHDEADMGAEDGPIILEVGKVSVKLVVEKLH